MHLTHSLGDWPSSLSISFAKCCQSVYLPGVTCEGCTRQNIYHADHKYTFEYPLPILFHYLSQYVPKYPPNIYARGKGLRSRDWAYSSRSLLTPTHYFIFGLYSHISSYTLMFLIKFVIHGMASNILSDLLLGRAPSTFYKLYVLLQTTNLCCKNH